MHVIRHHHKRVGFHARMTIRQLLPNRVDHFTAMIDAHGAINDLSEQTFPSLSANGHEVRTRLRIIVSPQPYGAAVTLLTVEGHARTVIECVALDKLTFVRRNGPPPLWALRSEFNLI